MRLNKHEFREKQYLRLREQANKLYKEQRLAPPVEVEPYKAGWIISAYLRYDAARRSDAPEMLEALKVCTRSYITSDVGVVRAARAGSTTVKAKGLSKRVARALRAAKRRRRTEARLNSRFGYHLSYKMDAELHYSPYERGIIPEVYGISKEKYDSLPNNLKRFFYFVESNKTYHWKKGEYWCNIPSYYIRAKAEVNWVTHTENINPTLISQEKFLDNKANELGERGYGGNKWANYGKSYPRGNQRTQFRTDVKRFLTGEAEDIMLPQKVPLEYEY